ncbi:hypothetical protein [Nocardia brasiliensis]|uniref:hypothetical protein n=1 Tax=Nocardia brasiliensis TaxID=37326 RepID=UPI0024585FE1|nr:hypothetical protein [Nocardia brasiliensis]
MSVERRTAVAQSKDGTWLWIGSISSRHPDGSPASYVSRWGAAGLATEADAQSAADEWLRTYQDPGGHAVPGLGGMHTENIGPR